jgi:hypothetical protein
MKLRLSHDEPVNEAAIAVAVAAASAMLLALIFGGTVIKLAVCIVGVTVLQGLWSGGLKLIGVVAGLVLALPLGALVGKSLEGAVGAMTATSGLLARFISMGIVAAVVIAACSVASRVLARRLRERYPAVKRWDPLLGAGMGLAEGSLIALMLLWGPLVLEPIARAQLNDDGRDPREGEWRTGPAPHRPPPSPLARTVVSMADAVHQSALGGLAERTNPVAGSGLLALAADFAEVSRDEDAMRWLLAQPVMDTIEALPSVQEAVETFKGDPALAGMFKERQGVTVDELRAVLESPVVLRVLDRTTVVRDVAPLTDELAAAIREAKARVRKGPPPSP